MSGFYLGIDIGTTAIKSILMDSRGGTVKLASQEQKQFFPKAGWAEQDAEEIFQRVLSLAHQLMEQCPGEIRGLGLDHQGETCLIWDKATGKPVYPAITWQDRRMAEPAEAFAATYGEKVTGITGLRSDSYYSAWKLRWLLDHIPEGQKRAESGELLAGTLNTWIIWKLTGGTSFVTDEGSTGVMMMVDPRHKGWHSWLLEIMNLPIQMLPEIRSSVEILGRTDPKLTDGREIPILASMTDCAAGIIGAGAVGEGEMTVTYGTGNFMHLQTGEHFISPCQGLTSAVCFTEQNRKHYQLNGICYTAGSAISWLQNELHLIESAAETEKLALGVHDTNGVYFVPALNGLATPTWDQSARGAFLGITAGCNRAHMVRAVLESSALQVARCCMIMEKTVGHPPEKIFAMGGMTHNSFLMQFQADVAGIPVVIPSQSEPCYGAACAAAMVSEKDMRMETIHQLNSPIKQFLPGMNENERHDRVAAWSYAVERTLDWHPKKNKNS